MGRILYYGAKVLWKDGRSEMFRSDSEEQALLAERYQFVENWTNIRSVPYVGRHIHWASLWQEMFSLATAWIVKLVVR